MKHKKILALLMLCGTIFTSIPCIHSQAIDRPQRVAKETKFYIDSTGWVTSAPKRNGFILTVEPSGAAILETVNKDGTCGWVTSDGKKSLPFINTDIATNITKKVIISGIILKGKFKPVTLRNLSPSVTNYGHVLGYDAILDGIDTSICEDFSETGATIYFRDNSKAPAPYNKSTDYYTRSQISTSGVSIYVPKHFNRQVTLSNVNYNLIGKDKSVTTNLSALPMSLDDDTYITDDLEYGTFYNVSFDTSEAPLVIDLSKCNGDIKYPDTYREYIIKELSKNIKASYTRAFSPTRDKNNIMVDSITNQKHDASLKTNSTGAGFVNPSVTYTYPTNFIQDGDFEYTPVLDVKKSDTNRSIMVRSPERQKVKIINSPFNLDLKTETVSYKINYNGSPLVEGETPNKKDFRITKITTSTDDKGVEHKTEENVNDFELSGSNEPGTNEWTVKIGNDTQTIKLNFDNKKLVSTKTKAINATYNGSVKQGAKLDPSKLDIEETIIEEYNYKTQVETKKKISPNDVSISMDTKTAGTQPAVITYNGISTEVPITVDEDPNFAEMMSLEKELDGIKSEIKNTNSDSKTTNEQISNLTNNVTSLQNEIKGNNVNNDRLMSQLTNIDNQLKNIVNKNNAALPKQNNTSETIANQKALENKISSLNKTIASLQSNANKDDKTIQDAEKEIEELNHQIKTLTKENKELKEISKSTNSEVKSMSAKMDTLNNSISKTKSSNIPIIASVVMCIATFGSSLLVRKKNK